MYSQLFGKIDSIQNAKEPHPAQLLERLLARLLLNMAATSLKPGVTECRQGMVSTASRAHQTQEVYTQTTITSLGGKVTFKMQEGSKRDNLNRLHKH